jgi:hypothetical protein
VIVLAALAAVAVIVVVAVSALGGGSSPKSGASTSASTAASTGRTGTGAKHKAHPSKSTAAPASAAETTITVLNGTETAGLAHRFSASLQQRGYSQAAALGGRPPGANQTTSVEYASGHQADAEAVARTLSVQAVQPVEAAVAALAGSADVVVIVGADKAASGP